MSNSLIIGLGGTGGKIIHEFRKRYFEEFKSFKPEDGMYIEYLYVDSDEGDLKTNWRYQGTSIGLNSAQKVSTHGMNISDLDQLTDRPSLNGFIGYDDVDLIKDKLGKVISEGIGGQRRRLGRMLMASHNNRQDGFAKQLQGRVQALQNQSKQQDVHFHIVAGLAGGTGSGSVIDAVAQIRKIYGNAPQVHLYLYVPEQQTIYADNVDYYKANGYAALLEINALQTGIYKPVDIGGEKDPFTREAVRIDSAQPINGTYLFTNVNEKGTTLRLQDELPEMVGDFLFQKIVVDKDSTANERLRRIEKFENGDPTDEKDASDNRTRSIKFLSFGFRRVIFPEEEIKEYIAYKFAERAALQMHFQKFTSQGFTSVSRQDATDEITAALVKDEREIMSLGNKILMRESAIAGADPLRDFNDEFKLFSDGFADESAGMDKNEMLLFYNGNMEAVYNKKFRKMGVADYFVQETSDTPKFARKIVGKIEEQLFQRWENGVYGALQLEEYIKLLLKDCDKHIAEITKSRVENESRIKTARAEKERGEDEVSKSRLFGNTFGKRDEKFARYRALTVAYYVALTRNEAYKYAVALLEAIKTCLQELESIVMRFSALLSLVTEKAEIQANLRCNDDEINDAKTMRKYDRNAVNEIKDKAVRDEDTQKQIARNVRNALVNHIGETASKSFMSFLKSFDALDENLDIPSDNMLNVILEVCLQSAEKEVEDRSMEDKRLKVTNVNILEKLRQEYDDVSGEKLNAFAHELMQSAQGFVRFDQSEMSLESNGNTNKLMNAVIVYLPEEKDDSGFRDRLAQAFIDAKGGADKVTIANSPRQDQIAIMTLNSMFPLRFVENVKNLKGAYDKLVNSPNSEIHKLVLHTETLGNPLPSLFEASVQEMAMELPKPVMLAFAMGIIKEGTDSVTGRKGLYIYSVDKFGDATRSEQPIGKDFIDVLKYLASHRQEAAKVKDLVKSKLEKEYVHVDARKELIGEVNNVLRTIVREAVGGDEFSPEYVKYKNIRNEIADNELNTD